uniref:Uncharacterized protein n=1 Tax=Arundo donax TaxID=35708 RepID=A0A0A9BZX1_ARUDO
MSWYFNVISSVVIMVKVLQTYLSTAACRS